MRFTDVTKQFCIHQTQTKEKGKDRSVTFRHNMSHQYCYGVVSHAKYALSLTRMSSIRVVYKYAIVRHFYECNPTHSMASWMTFQSSNLLDPRNSRHRCSSLLNQSSLLMIASYLLAKLGQHRKCLSSNRDRTRKLSLMMKPANRENSRGS